MSENEPSSHPPSELSPRETDAEVSEERRVSAVVGLALLEVIRARDLPAEILDAENPAETMPRRLGLSEAVTLQIERLRKEVRKRRRMTDDETRDLFRLVLRRPDAGEVFFQAGEVLAGKEGARTVLGRIYPRSIRFSLARRQVSRRLRALFGRTIGGFGKGSFRMEAGGHFLLEMDGSGHACSLLTGLAGTILSRYLGQEIEVAHSSCRGRKDDLCLWIVSSPDG